MGKVNVQKRGKVYQYQFEIAPVNGKRKFKNKSGFKSRSEAEKEGIKAYTEYMNTGHAFTHLEISYSDYLDYWMKEYFEINYKYSTARRYKESFSNIKNELGIQCRFYDLRSGFATISLRGGFEIKDVAEVLGHKRIETTQKYYILSLEENKKKVTEVFEDEMNKI